MKQSRPSKSFTSEIQALTGAPQKPISVAFPFNSFRVSVRASNTYLSLELASPGGASRVMSSGPRNGEGKTGPWKAWDKLINIIIYKLKTYTLLAVAEGADALKFSYA